MKIQKTISLGLTLAALFSLMLVSGCLPEAPAGEEGTNSSYLLLIMAVIFGLFIFLRFRSQRKVQKDHQQMTDELRLGDRVVTAGGIYGKVESLDPDSVVLKIESGTIRIDRRMVRGKQQT